MTGQIVSHFRVLEKLGGGGMGVVYLAADLELDRTVALKFLPAHLTQNEGANERFVQEAKAASALNHPNVCTIHEIGRTDDGQQFIAMAHYEGRTLKALLRDGPLPVAQAVECAHQIADGLARAHERGVVHRDIKPANIIITDDGRAVILDFGLAKLAGAADLTKTGSTVGTMHYMSPEQARGEQVDERSDVWSLGATLYEMLTGRKPFHGDYEQAVMYSVLNADPEPPRSLRSDVPPDLEQLVLRTLRKDAGERYANGAELAGALSRFARPQSLTPEAGGVRGLLRPIVLVPAGLLLVIVALAVAWQLQRQSKIRWARSEAIPQIRQLVETGWRDFTEAYALAEEVEKVIPDDPELAQLFGRISLPMSVHTTPPGAAVFAKSYQSPDAAWRFLGVTPLDSVRMPVGVFRWQLALAGYDTVRAVASSWDIKPGGGLLSPYVLERTLEPSGTAPPGMVRVPASATPAGSIAAFYLDEREVTNREFKQFMDDGGYADPAYWKHEFYRDGRRLDRDVAMAAFVDRTGRPGPAGWEAGDYREGEGDYPVTGVSWYEAAAYAAYAGKVLPTSTHWGLARGEGTPVIQWPQLGGFAVFAPYSNFGHDGPVAAGSLPGITAYGAYDMAGNAREWCYNETPEGRAIRGGAWNDNTYMFNVLSQAPAFDRSLTNGFRCALYHAPDGDPVPAPDSVPEPALARIDFGKPVDFTKMTPVPDDIYAVYRERFSYDPAPLDAKVESREEREEWVHERITFTSVSGSNDRIIAHLFLPQGVSPPYQTVIYFPGSGVRFQSSSEGIENYFEFPVFLSYFVKNGRAVMFPVYTGTFERQIANQMEITRAILGGNSRSRAYTDYTIDVVKDFRRSVDYLLSRDDIDADRIAYWGMSWGGIMGAIIPALETRIATAMLLSGGFQNIGRPEVHQVNYAGRIRMPLLMLNGRYDSIFPVDRSIRPLFDAIGTPKENKELKLFESDHIVPKTDYIRETLEWLDRYLGPVR